ncbi:MAG: hypothetical protein OEZ39_18465 [Gammaproteobacteria bacterium]|nr:hypothetical protein [Gammaproteobacteria bacterium]
MSYIAQCLTSLSLFLALTAAQAGQPHKGGGVPEVIPSLINKHRTYRLQVNPCQTSICKIDIQLLEQQRILDTKQLDWTAGSDEFSSDKAGQWYGIGDPLEKESQYDYVIVGTENDYVTLITRTVRLDENTEGLLVIQSTGVEHTKRRHDLYMSSNDKLQHLWSKEEGNGPTWSTVTLHRISNGTELIRHFSGVQAGGMAGDEMYDSHKVSTWQYDPADKKLRKQNSTAIPLYYVAIHPFNSITAAAEYQTKYIDCLEGMTLILDPKQHVPSIKSKAILAMASSDKQRIASTVKRLQGCLPDKKVQLIAP